ncbi:hypothetical protein [Portibacter lacus]|uniref:DUF5103 domain-containing protein n=1 Tax=Portibacter lacus TaxID=1099794 RepID=A0AA37SQV4_9BACT|nr:hypothetical protein [Portibacter lacus]GLR18190.1 hypothetical protein GCM10007940_28050 [Portibacter lacus]
MKQAKLMFFLLLSIGISAQEFSISDEAITFPNGKKLNIPVNIHHRYIIEYNEDTETYYFYEKISLHIPSFEFKDVDADRTVNIN